MTAVASAGQGTGVPGVQGCGSRRRVGGRTLHLLLAVWPPLLVPLVTVEGFDCDGLVHIMACCSQ